MSHCHSTSPLPAAACRTGSASGGAPLPGVSHIWRPPAKAVWRMTCGRASVDAVTWALPGRRGAGDARADKRDRGGGGVSARETPVRARARARSHGSRAGT